ncbi:helix-turn-helix transcriptional regulator [Kitasatospora sp. MBT66]|uniref:helix-turn-helix domain-containing protein n=1 Tax=Kitasatospora sp. MBT66 TaxID=1444769 RepID=UPI001E60F159|nr:helix-turn-helix transcriptional regulator [Kitasatospora sp. MBT66]
MDQPTARQVRLGSALRTLRLAVPGNDNGQEAVAKRLGFTESKLSRIESGKIGISDSDFAVMLDLYGPEENHRAYLFDLRKRSKVVGWEADVRNSIDPDYADYIGYEGDAFQAFNLETGIIPGLLQTREYAVANSPASPWYGHAEIEESWKVKQRRQQVLTKPNPLRLWTIISESAFRHEIGGPEVMRAQLLHLIDLSESLPNLSIQVLPEKSPAHGGLFGPYMILSFRERWEPDIVYIEGLTDTRWVERPDKVTDYGAQFNALMANAALRREESISLIREHANRL